MFSADTLLVSVHVQNYMTVVIVYILKCITVIVHIQNCITFVIVCIWNCMIYVIHIQNYTTAVLFTFRTMWLLLFTFRTVWLLSLFTIPLYDCYWSHSRYALSSLFKQEDCICHCTHIPDMHYYHHYSNKKITFVIVHIPDMHYHHYSNEKITDIIVHIPDISIVIILKFLTYWNVC